MKRHIPERHTTFFNLTDAMAEDGCALCRLVARAEHDTLDALLYENVNDPATHKALSASLGFCPLHSELATHMSDAFGIAVLYEALCRDAASRFTGDSSLEPTSPCPICRSAVDSENRHVAEFCLRLREPDFRDKFLASESFCLRHYQRVESAIPDGAMRETVRAHEAATLLALADQLRLFIDKHDYKKAATFGPEAIAWLRALEKFSSRRVAVDGNTK